MSTVSEYTAKHRFARISVRKLRPILDLIRVGRVRGRRRRGILQSPPHRGVRMIERVTPRARWPTPRTRHASATSATWSIDRRSGRRRPDVQAADAPLPRGMAYMIRRRSAHIEIGLADLVAAESATVDEDQA